MPCDNVLVQRASLQLKAGQEILADDGALETLRTWIEQVLGLKARISYRQPTYATIEASGLSITITTGNIGVSSRSLGQREVGQYAERIQKFAAKLGVTKMQDRLTAAVKRQFVVDSDVRVPQGRLLKVNI